MDTTRLQQARRLFNSEFIDRQANRRNMRQWIYSLRMLGDKWLLLQQQPKNWRQQ